VGWIHLLFIIGYYLMMLSVSRLYSINDRMINDNGTVGGTRIGRETEVLEANLPQYHFLRQRFHMM
jgi:hypothetical protein